MESGLLADPEILVLDEPTAGIDIGSKSEIIRLVRELAKSGKVILIISSELPELLTACDHIVIMTKGRATARFSRHDLDDPTIPADDTLHQLQSAERRLQSEIQVSLTQVRGREHVH